MFLIFIMISFFAIFCETEFVYAMDTVKSDFIEQSTLTQEGLIKKLEEYNHKSNKITFHLENYNRRPEGYIYIKLDIFDQEKNNIGHIDFTVNKGMPFHLQGDSRVNALEKYPYGDLWKIEIYPDFQGKRYSSDALSFYHEFLDSIGADFSVLGIDSKTKYAGNTYKKAGYDFTQRTKNSIKKWGEENGIPGPEAEARFLEDTSRPLENGFPPCMVRFNPLKK